MKFLAKRNLLEVAVSQTGEDQTESDGRVFCLSRKASFYSTCSTGHVGPIRSFSWSHDDRRLCSCGYDGAVYEWDIKVMIFVLV